MPNRTKTRSALACAAEEHQSAAALKQSNERLAQENARLAAAQQAVRQLVSGVAHDMRTHLAVINDYASLVREGLAGDTTPDQRRYLEIVGDRVDDLATMIDDLHDTSRLVSGTLRLWRRECRIADLIEQRLTHWRHRAAGRKVAFDCTAADDLPTVYCDADRIGRVIHHLVVEAIKRAPAGGEVTLWARTDGNRRAIVGVTQVGQPADESEIRSISAELARENLDLAASTELKLPLAIANSIVRLNLGQMTVERDAPDRCTYSFTLPVHEPLPIVDCHARRMTSIVPCSAEVALLIAQVDDNAEVGVVPVVDEFLQSAVGPNDLVVQVAPRRWLLAASGQAREPVDLLERLTAAWSDTLREWPLGAAPRLEISVAGRWQGATACEQLLREAQQLLRLLDEEGKADRRPAPKRRSAVAAGSR